MTAPILPIVAGAARVRLATPEDADEIIGICYRLHNENGRLAICERKMREVLQEAFDGKSAVIGVIGEPGKIEGCILLRVGQFWYSEQWILEEMFNFVLPEHRRSTNAVDLIEFAKRCSEHMGVPLFIGVISNERTQSKVRLYERRLNKPVGAFFVWNETALPGRIAVAS